MYVTIGATVATFVARVTARDATTVTVSLTAVSGTPPATDLLGLTTMKIGGAWKGPNAAVAFPFNFAAAAMTNAAGDTPRVNIKNGTTYSITAAMTHSLAGPCRFQGYTSTVGDGGRATIDGGTSGASYILLAVSGINNTLADLIFQNNGATGSADGVSCTGVEAVVKRCVFNSMRGNGLLSSGTSNIIAECEGYSCNQSDTANMGGFDLTAAQCVRVVSHDNAGANAHGIRASGTSVLVGCIAESNGGIGISLISNNGMLVLGCEAYNNASDGIRIGNASGAAFYIENCNLIKNGGWGINGSGAGPRNGAVVNCGFGAGTQANTSGATTGLKSMTESGTVTYSADATPWIDPANGDFRISLAAAKGTGRGSYTQTAASYAGTVGYPDIGAAQSRGGGSKAIPRIGRSGAG